MSDKKRVFCLYRVSTTGQLDKNTLANEKDDIPMQKHACEEFCERMGWEIVDSRSEKGVSGYKVSANDRDAIIDIMEAATKKQFDILHVYMFDRLDRKEDETPFIANGLSIAASRFGVPKKVNRKLNSMLINFLTTFATGRHRAKARRHLLV